MTYKLIIGLGNPGSEYENTYHNVGAIALNALADNGAKFKKYKSFFEYAAKDDGTTLVKTLVFMNDSGRAAHEAAKMFGAAPEEILVIHDESDLPVGEFKISQGGGSAGHKGVQSLIDHLGSNKFWRARIGIRDQREQTRKKAEEFVLSKIRESDRVMIDEAIRRLIDTLREKPGMSS